MDTLLVKNNQTIMEQITYEDFAKLHIGIGTILTVEIVEGADKLLKLAVEVGEEKPRQILSGIREYFADPQVLVGKQFPFVLNLAPRVIRGFESQGMILAASYEDALALLAPTITVAPGTKVK
jgi:methionyl-tRNA synthetase